MKNDKIWRRLIRLGKRKNCFKFAFVMTSMDSNGALRSSSVIPKSETSTEAPFGRSAQRLVFTTLVDLVDFTLKKKHCELSMRRTKTKREKTPSIFYFQGYTDLKVEFLAAGLPPPRDYERAGHRGCHAWLHYRF